MTWHSTQKKEEKSPFLKGKCIYQKLKNSNFEKAKTAIVDIFGEDGLKKYELPKIVCIGNESTGKSSLLENITKCQIFPRDSKLCTKSPVHVIMKHGERMYKINCDFPEIGYGNTVMHLNNKEDIYPTMKEIFGKMDADALYENEIVITIQGPNMYNFELYDLPGIRTYPEQLAKQSVDICKKYLSDPSCIVICVAPATTTRLTSCQSIALVNEYKKNSNCILALTMSDRVQTENIEELLVNRIAGISDEMSGLDLYGCVAVINRNHTNNSSLTKSNSDETKWFNENIIAQVPKEYTKDFIETLRNNVTIINLINKIDNLYNKFIHNDWKPTIMEDMKRERIVLNNKYEQLGTTTIHIEKIKDNIKKEMARFLVSYPKEYTCLSATFSSMPKESDEYGQLIGINEEMDASIDTKCYKLHLKVKDITSTYFENTSIMLVKIIIDKITDNIFKDTSLPYKMERFSNLKEKIRKDLMAIYMRDYSEKLAHMEKIISDLVDKHLIRSVNTDKINIEGYVDRYYKTNMVLPIFQIYDYKFVINDFKENKNYASQRVKLLSEIGSLDSHYTRIQEQL